MTVEERRRRSQRLLPQGVLLGGRWLLHIKADHHAALELAPLLCAQEDCPAHPLGKERQRRPAGAILCVEIVTIQQQGGAAQHSLALPEAHQHVEFMGRRRHHRRRHAIGGHPQPVARGGGQRALGGAVTAHQLNRREIGRRFRGLRPQIRDR